MFRKVQSMVLLTLCCAVFSVPADSMDQSTGQILGGSLNSPIRLEIFSDFQCPACRDLYLGTIRQVLEEYASKDKVCVIYHEYPLSIHPYAREAARYCEAASRWASRNCCRFLIRSLPTRHNGLRTAAWRQRYPRRCPATIFRR